MARIPKPGSRLRLQNWRVRSRLVALILIPTIVGVILGAMQLTNAISTSAEYRRLSEVATLIQKVDVLVHEVARERDLTAWYIAEGRRPARLKKVRAQQDVVDKVKGPVLAAVAVLGTSHTARVRAEGEQVRRWLDGLPGLRTRIADETVPARAALGTYSRLVTVLGSLHSELGTPGADQRLFRDGIALAALSRAKEEVSHQRGLLAVGLASRGLPGGGFGYDDFVEFPGSWSRQQSELATFFAEADPADAKFYNETVRGQQVDKADGMRALALAQLRQYKEIQDLDPSRRDDTTLWYTSISVVNDRMRQVEQRLADSVVRQSLTSQEDAQWQVVVSGGLILLLLLLVLTVTAVVARSLTRPLRRLRAEALEIAGLRLPETVQRLRDSTDDSPSAQVTPIGVTSRDEMGEVARAFDEVHREAVRLAGEEARLRSNVNAMFVNLSRRSQTLVERQLTLIDGLEQGEQDENRLADLFKLDHLATRMRRNSENLLVLAEQETVRRWSRPVPLVDVVRAALSAVENYERVEVRVPSGEAVVGQAVNDVVHLVAELVENAISFSPRETSVLVSSDRVDDGGVVISVSDSGIGMTSDELSESNRRLAEPPVVDVSVSRRMGLFVVGRLALRHGIRVQLRQQDGGGLTAMVLLPQTLLATPGASSYPGMPAGLTGPMAGAGRSGAPVPSLDTGGAAPPGGAPGSESRGMRSPVFGADDAGIGAPPGPAHRGPFERGPFERPAPGQGAEGGERGPFEPDTFERYFMPDPPLDTPWPSNVPPPGASVSRTGAWPDLADQDTASWPAVAAGGHTGPLTGGGPVGRAGDSFGAVPDADRTGPLPAVLGSPLEGPEEYLPIFAAVESDWFRRSDAGPGTAEQEEMGPATAPRAAERSPYGAEDGGRAEDPVVARPAQTGAWSSPADAGWQAAKAASEPALGGLTTSGLPKRVPKANLVPGSADPGPSLFDPQPSPSPDRVRNRLSSFQDGVRRGRAVARGEHNDDLSVNGIGERNKEDS